MKESKFVKTKIFAGYAILIAVCVLSVGYVYRTVVRFSTPDGSYSLLHTKRSVVGQTLYHLYQAESYGQLMIAGYQSYESRYKRELRTVRGMIDSLRRLTAAEDSLQTMRLDSIVRLLADKERRTMSLRRTIRSAATASLLEKNIRELIGPADSVMHVDSVVVRPDTVASRVVVQDTVTVPRRKRKFFRRFADLFSPPKEEAGMIISRHERVVDSLPAPEMKDTIAVVLRTLQDRVTSERIGIYDRAWDEGMRLRYSNELVNTKIYRLIMDFEAEDTAFLMDRFEQTEAIRRRSSLTLGVIAVAAVVLMLLFVGILWRDINRSNRYRRALERANRDNEALLAAREKLMLAITHDIKAPLGSVMGYIDLLSRLTDDKREELYLHNMKESSEHLLALVNSLLDFYRLDINKVDVDKVAFCPEQLFETIRTGFAAQAAAKGIGLRLDVEPAAGREVAGDPFRIRQIADNLISNALKFTDEGSVTIRVDVVQGRLVFSVRDTGRGIGREEKERIFQEFVRLRSAQGVDGFGLGLSIVDRLVKLLEGTISLESRLGEGSKFIVSIPVGVVSGGGGRKPLPAGGTPQAACSGVRALLIDDDPLQLEMTAAMCRQAGIGAECCQYPEYAAKQVAEGDFGVVLTDIQMPSADGFSVLAAVRGVNPALPVVAVSARGEIEAADFAARGFAGCLRKPFTANELIAVLNAIRSAENTGAAGDAGNAEKAGGAGKTVGAGNVVGEGKIVGKECADGAAEDSMAAADDTVVEAVSGDGVNFDPLTAYAGDDAEAARGILKSFAEQSAANCRLLEEALASSDDAALRAVAHKMLPIFTMLGAAGVAATLRTAESWEGPLTDALRGEIGAAAEKIRAIVAEAQKKVSLS
ncbi:MAG: ATP-binding protein [Alistipes sp.]|uniref:ATP-binding protein n=1 Tax=Alistipes sp. TaxID=1872444 RepID=UPI0025B86C4E|nr:ATP-binding protein [Alistipes sp.]MCD8274915.1 ATP-binding protein [Alistipes sp.]